jgi:hypothetical protein
VKQLVLLNEFRDLMSQLVTQVQASTAMGHYDINKVSEGLVLGVLRALYGWDNLRDLNAEEKANFPGIDLADDELKLAIQVTGTPTLDKIKSSIQTLLKHDLDKRYQRLVFYVLTRKQASYSQDAIDRVAANRISIDASKDIIDIQEVCAVAATAQPARLLAALEVVRAYMRGAAGAAVVEDFDPPLSPTERANLNLIEVYFPETLYVADLRDDRGAGKATRAWNERKKIRTALTELGLRVPSDYEVSGGQIITFHSLEDGNGPFARLVDLGTTTPLRPNEFYETDDDNERIFKSLLRFALQQKLYKHRVRWMHQDGLFVFLPNEDTENLREEVWVGHKRNTRRVFERKLNKKDITKTFICKHFAFGADFILNQGRWYVALTPDWYFSYGDDYRRSRYADASLKWLKKREVNRTVADHFRFIASWLAELDQEDLFAAANSQGPTMTFGEIVQFDNNPALSDESWLPSRDSLDDEDSPIKGLFDT